MVGTLPTLNDALHWHQTGELDRAKEAYHQLLKVQPENADLLHLLGIVYSQQTQFSQALAFLEKAIALDPNCATYHNSMGNVQKKLGNEDKAIAHYQQALRTEPNSIGALNNLASIFLAQKHLEQAIDYYQQALSIAPNFVDSHYNLALCYLRQEQFAQAKAHLQKVVELDAQHFFALAHLGKLLLSEGNFSSAIELLETSLKLFPDQIEAQVNLGAAKVKIGDLEGAITHFKRALDVDPTHFEAHYNLGCTYINLHQPKQALEHFLQLVHKHPTPEIFYNIGVIYLYQDHHSEAITYLQEAVRLDSHYLDALINLGVTYLKMQQSAKAIEYFKKALAIAPNNAEVQYILSALQGDQTPTKAPEQYVRHLFDQYAPHYETHLKKFLDYHTPENLLEVVKAALTHELDNLVILDLGCGTGLTGEVFKPYAKRLVGIDLSPKMIEAASKKNIYDDLHIADIHVTLGKERDVDLVVAGDVLSYLGDLELTFKTTHNALKENGYFAFSLERSIENTRDYQLQSTGRFTHNKVYIDRLCQQYPFKIVQEALVTLRRQFNQPVQGWLIVLQKQSDKINE